MALHGQRRRRVSPSPRHRRRRAHGRCERETHSPPPLEAFAMTSTTGIVIEEKNWPPFFPIIHHDIGKEIPIHLQRIQYIAFTTWLGGGPGSGKGTQCEKIVETFGFKHLSAGDLLRREMVSDSEYGSMILNTIREGSIVPSGVTVKLIQREMESSDNHKFLIDGFPRSEENRVAFEHIVGAEPSLVLFFDCPEEEMVKRVLSRNQGRIDDNIDTIKTRLKVFEALNLPVVDYYAKRGKLYRINAVGTVDEIFEQVRPVFEACEHEAK